MRGINVSYKTNPENWFNASNVSGFVDKIGVVPKLFRPTSDSKFADGVKRTSGSFILGKGSGTDTFGCGRYSRIASRSAMNFGVGSPDSSIGAS